MCGRASLNKIEKELEARFQAVFYPEEQEAYQVLPNYNIAPTHYHPVITHDDRGHLQYFRWGLIPFWAKDVSIGSRLINARSETVAQKPAFKNALHKRRCLVPFDGFYEWKRAGKVKTPYRITWQGERIFCIAGLWESWKSPEGAIIHSFTLLTQPPNDLMATIHNRMPAILLPEQEALWIDPALSAEAALQLIHPLPETLLRAYPVSKRVNKVTENDAALLEPAPPDGPQQGKLF